MVFGSIYAVSDIFSNEAHMTDGSDPNKRGGVRCGSCPIQSRELLTFIQIGGHALVVSTDQCIVLRSSGQHPLHLTSEMIRHTSYKLVPCTGKKLINPLASPFASSNLRTDNSLS